MKKIVYILSFMWIFCQKQGLAAPTQFPWDLDEPKRQLSILYCPSVQLTGHCGNGTCEKLLGETKQNCSMDCDPAPISSWNASIECRNVQAVYTPQNAKELASLVQNAAHEGMHVKVVGNKHSSTEIICTDGIVISTVGLQEIKGIETLDEETVVKVQAGVTTYQLMAWLAERNYMLEGYTTPMFRSPTIAGALATSSHGSSVNHVANLTDIVRGFNLVNAQGELQSYKKSNTPDQTWRAMTASLGLLGVMTEVQLKVRPYRNLEATVTRGTDETLLNAASPQDLIKACDWGQFNWTPNDNKLLSVCGKETDKAADTNANNVILDALGSLPGGDNPIVKGLTYLSFDLLACNRTLRCQVAGPLAANYGNAPVFKTIRDKKSVSVDQVVGESYKLLTSQEPANQRVLQLRSRELIIPPQFQKPALLMLKKYHADNRCNALIGHYIRFSRITEASLLSPSRAGGKFPLGEYAMHIELGGYTPKGLSPEEFAQYDNFNDEIAKRLISEYGARPHWGKGESWYHLFYSQTDEGRATISQFSEIMRYMDPQGVFANEFAGQLGFN